MLKNSRTEGPRHPWRTRTPAVLLTTNVRGAARPHHRLMTVLYGRVLLHLLCVTYNLLQKPSAPCPNAVQSRHHRSSSLGHQRHRIYPSAQRKATRIRAELNVPRFDVASLPDPLLLPFLPFQVYR